LRYRRQCALLSRCQGAAGSPKETLDGVTNFNRLETTVACAGAIKATAVPELKKMVLPRSSICGQASGRARILGRSRGREAAAFTTTTSVQRADARSGVADNLLERITIKREMNPRSFHWPAAAAAATMWFIKAHRSWTIGCRSRQPGSDRAGHEQSTLKQFGIDYAQTHKR